MNEINLNDILTKWDKDIEQISFILQYLHTYPEILKKIEIEDLITPDEIIPRYEEWINLYLKYEGLEKEFFKPYWLPLQRNSYEYFLDISDNQYPVFSFFFMPFEPYSYSKQMLFDSISEFMLLEDNEYEIKRFKYHKFDELMLQIKNKYKNT